MKIRLHIRYHSIYFESPNRKVNMRTILIADENADVRESISLMFSECADYRIVTASSGADAMQRIS